MPPCEFEMAYALAHMSRPMHLRASRELVPLIKRLSKNTLSQTPINERQLTVRRWVCEPVELRDPHDHPVALSYDSSAH